MDIFSFIIFKSTPFIAKVNNRIIPLIKKQKKSNSFESTLNTKLTIIDNRIINGNKYNNESKLST